MSICHRECLDVGETMFIEHVIAVTDRIMQKAIESDPRHADLDRLPSEQAQTVLLVSDDPILLDLLSNFLSGNGLRVLPVSSGEAAASLCLGYGRTIDVLVSDVEMHPVDGLQVAAVVRSAYPQVFVVLISGKPACRATRQSADEFLVKPFAQQDLLAALLRCSKNVE